MAATLPLILLPPSEGKALGGTGDPWKPGVMAIDLDDHRQKVIAALATAMRGTEAERAKLLGVSGRTLAGASASDKQVTKPRPSRRSSGTPASYTTRSTTER